VKVRCAALARVAEWQTRRTQNPLFERMCGFKSHLGHPGDSYTRGMGHRLLKRRLEQTASRMRELQTELRVVEDQLDHLLDDSHDKSLRALVAETPGAEFEYRDAKRHSDVMQKRRDSLVAELSQLESRINELLDRMKEPIT
jgi:vacuolar-type H+-ATPase subunit D/Vma8